MQLSLSASGSPESVKQTLATQVDSQLASAGEPCKALGAKVLEYVDTLSAGKTSVSVSGSVYLTVSGT